MKTLLQITQSELTLKDTLDTEEGISYLEAFGMLCACFAPEYMQGNGGQIEHINTLAAQAMDFENFHHNEEKALKTYDIHTTLYWDTEYNDSLYEAIDYWLADRVYCAQISAYYGENGNKEHNHRIWQIVENVNTPDCEHVSPRFDSIFEVLEWLNKPENIKYKKQGNSFARYAEDIEGLVSFEKEYCVITGKEL